MGEIPVDELRKEHQSLVAEIAELHAAIRGLHPSGADRGTFGSLRARVKMLVDGLLLHFRREEEGLFPDARQMISEGAQRADVFDNEPGGEAHGLTRLSMDEE